MSGALVTAVRKVFADAKKRVSSIKKLLNPPCESSFAGSRVYPARNAQKDKNYGIRFDLGQPVPGSPGHVYVNLQVNSNAEDKALQGLVKKHGSDKKYVTFVVDSTQAATEDNLEKLENRVVGKVEQTEV